LKLLLPSQAKKIEKQIQEGRNLKDLGPEAEKERHEERLVSPGIL
jgi:hypothetical protein